MNRFSNTESIFATRISLLRSVRQREERRQIGELQSEFTRFLLDMERQCLLRISEAARDAGQNQIALNSVIRAKHLDGVHRIDVSSEFANVLWKHNEEKRAVQMLKALRDESHPTVVKKDKLAEINARLVS
jgi:serine-protein kinase ATM